MKVSLNTRLCTLGSLVAIALAGAAAADAGSRPAASHYPPQGLKAEAATWTAKARALGGLTPTGMTAQEWKAEQIRGQALDKLYGGGAPEGMTPAEYRAELIRGEALDKLYGGGAPEGMTPAEYRAELIRGDALNKRYGLGEYAGTVNPASTPTQTGVVRPAQPVVSDGFDWSDAGIGAGAGIGFGLLAFGIALATRQARRPRLTTTG
jgi:hypothetical protein